VSVSDLAVRCEGLGKQYRLGERESYQALRDTISRVVSAPLRLFRPREAARRAGATIWALRDFSVEIRQGEIVGIMGRNGAGKSTLLKILSRITAPTEGRARIQGRLGSLLEVGTGFHPELTGRDNVYLNGVILGMRKAQIDARFDEIVDFAGVAPFIDTPVKRYSSGMQLRLAFAVAAHIDTDVLVVDEVLAVGDGEFQRRCIGKMEDISKTGRTVLFVSHNMTSLGTLCRRGILLDAGRKTFEGPIGDVINRYMTSVRAHAEGATWSVPETAPGDATVRLKQVRVVGKDGPASTVAMTEDFRVEVVYWNLQANARRVVSVHITNALGVTILTSANLPSASVVPDPWFARPYPVGTFATSCTIPGGLLNDGPHTISVFVNGSALATDNVIVARDVLAFDVQDTGEMRDEYSGPWLGAIRPRLAWDTTQLE
jgi:lipopolysaccharide transport system ATP-binding protein